MTTLENAARQALEALIWTTGSTDFGKFGHAHEGALKLLFPAIAALRQALEQPANWQEIECPCCGDLARAFPPAPAREWVGLTDVEIGDALIDLPVLGNGYFLRIVRAIESKLKEKNT